MGYFFPDLWHRNLNSYLRQGGGLAVHSRDPQPPCTPTPPVCGGIDTLCAALLCLEKLYCCFPQKKSTILNLISFLPKSLKRNSLFITFLRNWVLYREFLTAGSYAYIVGSLKMILLFVFFSGFV